MCEGWLIPWSGRVLMEMVFPVLRARPEFLRTEFQTLGQLRLRTGPGPGDETASRAWALSTLCCQNGCVGWDVNLEFSQEPAEFPAWR